MMSNNPCAYFDLISEQVEILALEIDKDSSWTRFHTPEIYPFTFKPFDYQRASLEASWDYTTAALFLDMGLGKSKVTIDTAGLLFLNNQITGLFILAPKGVYGNWVYSELPKHLPNNIDYKITQWTGSTVNKTKLNEYEQMLTKKDKPFLDIFVMNIDAIMAEGKASSGKGNRLARQFLLTHKSLMVIDESTKVKNPKAKRSIAAYEVGRLAKYRRILTGSPITKAPLDVYAQCAFLSKELLGFGNFYAFRNRYAVIENCYTFGGQTYKKIVDYQNESELTNKLQRFSIRLIKEQCLDLPPKQYLTRHIEMTTEQKKYYEQLRKEALIVLDDDEVSVTIVLTQLLRFRQICCGFLKTDKGNTVEIKCNKLTELLDTIEEINGKVIIWSHFVEMGILKIAETLRKAYGEKSVVTYYGDTKDRETPIKEFENNPDVRFFVANPSVGGYGITLNAASYVIYYDSNYDLEVRQQSETRNYRIGQKTKVVYIDLVTKDTIEENIVEALINKYLISAKVLKDKILEWIKK